MLAPENAESALERRDQDSPAESRPIRNAVVKVGCAAIGLPPPGIDRLWQLARPSIEALPRRAFGPSLPGFLFL
jgi:hypothetical protein